MRILFISLLLFAPLQSFGQELPHWATQKMDSLSEPFQPSHYLSPNFLEADFNGDGKTDIAVAVVHENKHGIAFLLQEGSAFVAGAGIPFGPGGRDFSWADEWRVFNKKKTYRITFKENGEVDGEQEVLLKNPAISIRQSEGSGGLIYFDGEKFTWIHQGG